MATLFRVAGIPTGTVDQQTREITFRMQIEDGRQLEFVAPVTVIEQMAATLGALSRQIGQAAAQAVNAQDVAQYAVQRDAFGGPVILRIVTTGGIPHMFAVPLDAAGDIAARLKSESEKGHKPGHA